MFNVPHVYLAQYVNAPICTFFSLLMLPSITSSNFNATHVPSSTFLMIPVYTFLNHLMLYIYGFLNLLMFLIYMFLNHLTIASYTVVNMLILPIYTLF